MSSFTSELQECWPFDTDDWAKDKTSPPWRNLLKVLSLQCQTHHAMYAAYMMTLVYLTLWGENFHEYKQPWGLYLVCWGVFEIFYSTWQLRPCILQHSDSEQREVTVGTASRPWDRRCAKATQFVSRSTAEWKLTSLSAVTLCCQMPYIFTFKIFR